MRWAAPENYGVEADDAKPRLGVWSLRPLALKSGGGWLSTLYTAFCNADVARFALGPETVLFNRPGPASFSGLKAFCQGDGDVNQTSGHRSSGSRSAGRVIASHPPGTSRGGEGPIQLRSSVQLM